MANHKSALKRAKQNELRRIRNKGVKTRVKNIVKDIRLAVSERPAEVTMDMLNTAKSIIAKAAKGSSLHKKTASRKISRLTKLVNSVKA